VSDQKIKLGPDIHRAALRPIDQNPPRWGVLWRWGSVWIGVHYSDHHGRWCCNLIPFLTVWFIRKGGTPP